MNEQKFVVFCLGSERYGLPIESVERILSAQPVTRMPRAPKMILGVFELRGDTVAVMDVRTRFEMPSAEESKNFIVVLTDAGRCALAVDTVDGIVSYEPAEIDEPTAFQTSRAEEFVTGVGKKEGMLTLLIDSNLVVPEPAKKKLVAA